MDMPDLWVILYRYKNWSDELVWGLPTVICEDTVFSTEEEAIKHAEYWQQMGNESPLAVVKMTAIEVREV